MDEPQNHYTKWQKPDTRDHILYDSITWNAQKGKSVGAESLYFSYSRSGLEEHKMTYNSIVVA